MNRQMLGRIRKLLGAALLGAFAASASAQTPAGGSYAVVALIGDELSVVTYRPSVGTGRDANARQPVPVDDERFDRDAAMRGAAAIKRALPDATARPMILSDRSTMSDDSEVVTGSPRLASLLSSLAVPLARDHTQYLVVISKLRADARMRIANGTAGTGKLSGLGFYLDDRRRTTNRGDGKSGRGYVAPFAYITVSLVDVSSGAVVRSASATESAVLGTQNSDEATNAWEALTSDEKVRMLDGLLQRAIGDTVQRVVAPI